MNKIFLLLLFNFLVLADFTMAQSDANKNPEISYPDSAVYYFQQSRHGNQMDTITFEKAIEFLGKADLDQPAISRIKRISEDFRNQNQQWFSEQIELAIIFNITRSDNMNLAIAYCKNLVNLYDVSRKPDDRYIALIALMELRIPLRTTSISEAFDYYASRLQVYLEKNDSSGLSISYFCLGTVYRLAGLPDMAIYNIKKSVSYINKSDTLTNLPISGFSGRINNISVLGQLNLEVGDYETAIVYSREAREAKLNVLKEKNVSYLNCNIAYAKLMLNELDSVNDLLNSSLQLAGENNDYPSLVRTCEIKGQYFLAINQPDSAEVYLRKAIEILRLHDLNYFGAAGSHTPGYYLAKVSIMKNHYHDARILLEQEITKIGNIKKEVLKEQKLLIEVYNKLNDSKAADSTFKKYSEIQSFLNAEERKNRTKSFEVEEKISQAENTIHDLETEQRIAEITKKYLIGLVAILFIVATVIANRFMVTRRQKVIIEKEKQRSEELLLNILPAEVAEELKEKGSATAKQFNEVTVLFTDFKGFTELSEKLSPSNLVAEINDCFSAFDQIMQKHGVEKIKTIGDAYMAAGGIPTPNTTHAVDVVNAALDIQQFMYEHKLKKQAAGSLFFEIRIGIHTGSVVAGIVGVKKFAYDIWGDTVNTASRMESSGEVGKVNISETTYELVKDKFNCTHRGKIEAKHKGVIDMYFVERI